MEIGEKRSNGESKLETDEDYSESNSPPQAKKKLTWSDKIMVLVKKLNSFYNSEYIYIYNKLNNKLTLLTNKID